MFFVFFIYMYRKKHRMRRDICNIIVIIIVVRHSYIRVFLCGDVITIEREKKKKTNIVAIITWWSTRSTRTSVHSYTHCCYSSKRFFFIIIIIVFFFFSNYDCYLHAHGQTYTRWAPSSLHTVIIKQL